MTVRQTIPVYPLKISTSSGIALNKKEIGTIHSSTLQVAEYFEDYDPLRSGSISKSQFRRGMSLLGFSKLGQHDFSEGHYKLLCDVYQNPQKQDQVLWTKFLWDIETGMCNVEQCSR